MNRLSFGLLASLISLGGCGGGSSTSVSPIGSVVPQQQPQQFSVPQTLHVAVPPAPPRFVPEAPSAAQRAAAEVALRKFVPTKMVGARHASALANDSDPVARFHTSLGDIDVELSPSAAPNNVANFLSYVNNGAYDNSFIHRSLPGFIIQGGGYYYNNNQAEAIAQQAAVANEFHSSNVRGTLAMALNGSDINSATDQWFFNLANNSAQLDAQKYTVIGNIVNSQGLAVMDAIAAEQVIHEQSPFDNLPVVNYTSGSTVTSSNLVNVTSITQQPAPGFFSGEEALANNVYYLTFSNGNYFGYYSYLSDPRYIYHFDLGYEYVFDAADGHDGIYLYDFASNRYFYTSPTFPFPYLYDFTLHSVLYYYPDARNAGRYTSNPRYFYNFATGAIITE